MYGKATQNAIAAMSRLAEVYDGGKTRLSATEIAAARGLQKPFVSKLLSSLSTAGLVTGTRGPGGGFTLSRHPKKIKLIDVFSLFEREDDSLACPFGGGVCGVGDPCPLHDKLTSVQDQMDELLRRTTFDVFRVAYQDDGKRPTAAGKKPKAKRESYRAPVNRRRGG
ncbi:MAG: Rrf2 family transcriptional regulator [Planctomycetes bacterium]|nr:Rrf2 family transcriptional regulator [Planctomycetota bacterium]